MNTTLVVVLIVILLILLVVAAGAAIVLGRRNRSARLQQQFGPEYDRKVEETGARRSAESELRDREKRHKKLEPRSLSEETRRRYQQEWDGIQQGFVDEPGQAVQEADELATRIMHDRGYPVDDFEQRAADVSVDHPQVVQHYRAAHGVATANERGEASTEQLRSAVTSYRSLVRELLTEEGSNGHEARGADSSGKDQPETEDATGTGTGTETGRDQRR